MRSLRQLLGSTVVMALAAMPVLMGVSGCADEHKDAVIPFVGSADLKGVGLKEVWNHAIVLGPGESITNAWRVGDSVYVATNMATLVRIDAATGEQAWVTSLPQAQSEIFRPAETPDGKGVIVVNRGNAFCFSKLTGEEMLSKPLAISVMTDPVVAGQVLCIGGTGYYYGLWLDQLEGDKWRTQAVNDMFVAQPAVLEKNQMIIASREGHLWRISTDTGDWQWKDRKTNGLVTGGLGADAKAVYVPSEDKRVYAFDVITGGELWETLLDGTLDQTVVVTKTKVLVPSTGKGLYALGQSKGDQLWFAAGVSQIGTVMPGRVWVLDVSGELKSLNLDTGDVLGKAVIPAAQLLVRNAVDQEVILVNRAGVVAGYKAD